MKKPFPSPFQLVSCALSSGVGGRNMTMCVCGCASLFVIWIINDRNYFCLVQISVSHSSCWELYYCESECDWHLQCYTDNIRGISLYNIALLDTSPVHSQDNHNTEYFRNILQKYFSVLVYIKNQSVGKVRCKSWQIFLSEMLTLSISKKQIENWKKEK